MVCMVLITCSFVVEKGDVVKDLRALIAERRLRAPVLDPGRLMDDSNSYQILSVKNVKN